MFSIRLRITGPTFVDFMLIAEKRNNIIFVQILLAILVNAYKS